MSKKRIVEGWVDSYSDYLYSWALSRVKDRHLAEDFVQETFIKAIKGFEKFQEKSSPKTWLIRILQNVIFDHYRKSGRDLTKSFSDDSAYKLFDDNDNWTENGFEEMWESEYHLTNDEDFLNSFSKCIERLSHKAKDIIELRYLQDNDAAFICQELEISTSNYWQIIHRAKLALKDCLENGWFKTIES